MSDLKKSLKTLYRLICKDVKLSNALIYRNLLNEEINKHRNINDLSEVEDNIKLIEEYIMMIKHVTQENQLLESYNINVRRDSIKKIENVAGYVGLKI